MKIALTADLHFSGKSLQDIKKPWNKMITKMEGQGIDLLLIAGDVFDTSNIASRECSLGTILEVFRDPLERASFKTWIVEGNHDQARPGFKGALETLKHSNNIKVFTRPDTVIYTKEGGGDHVVIMALPWATKANMLAKEEYRELSPQEQDIIFREKTGAIFECLKRPVQDKFSILFGHCDIAGVQTAQGYILPQGAYEFTNMQIAGVADIVGMGHHHKRQGFYLGSPWQNNFGECGNETGYRLIETQDNKLISDEWIELNDAPAYEIVSTADYKPEDYKKGDYVEIRGEKAPAFTLPDRHTFKKIITKKDIQIRAEVSESESSPALFAKWQDLNLKDSEISKENLSQKLNELLAMETQAEVNSVGSLQKINSITLENIGAHKNTVVDFRDIDMAGISGENGSGKTFLLEAPLAVLFGEFPSRPGTIYDQITQGYIGDAKLKMEFESGGNEYIAWRDIRASGKTPSQKAYLYKKSKDGEKDIPISGAGKTNDFRNAIADLVGDKDLVYASVFSSQFGHGDITQLDPADRQEVFSKWLGLNKYLNISTLAGDKVKGLTGAIDSMEGNKKNLSEGLTNEAEYHDQICETRKAMEEISTSQKKLESEFEELLQRRGGIEGKLQERQGKEKQLTKLKNDIKTGRDESVSLYAEIKKDEEFVSHETKLKEDEEEYNKFQQELLLINEHNQKRHDIEKQLSDLKAKAENVKNNIQKVHVEFTNKTEKLDTQIGVKKEKAFNLTKAGCSKNIITDCPFISGAIEAEKELPALQEEVKLIREQVINKQFCLDERKIWKDLQAEINGIVIPEKKDPSIVQTMMNELKDSVTKMGQIQAVKNELENKKNRLRGIDGKILIMTAEHGGIEVELESIPQSIIEEERSCQEEIDGIKALIKDKNDDKELKTRLLANMESVLEANKNRASQMTLIENDIQKAEREKIEYGIISKAFGRNGIPQLLIDSVRPQIQDILDSLVENTGKNLQITFDTQRLLKGGGMKETLDILVSTDAGTRDIKQFSGGEQKLLRTIIRLSLGIFQSQRTANKFEVFFLDEIFDSLDKENSIMILQMLKGLSKHFKQVFIVSHTDELLQDMPCRINIKKENGISEVEIIN